MFRTRRVSSTAATVAADISWVFLPYRTACACNGFDFGLVQSRLATVSQGKENAASAWSISWNAICGRKIYLGEEEFLLWLFLGYTWWNVFPSWLAVISFATVLRCSWRWGSSILVGFILDDVWVSFWQYSSLCYSLRTRTGRTSEKLRSDVSRYQFTRGWLRWEHRSCVKSWNLVDEQIYLVNVLR